MDLKRAMEMYDVATLVVVCTLFAASSSLLVAGQQISQTKPMNCSLSRVSSCLSYLYLNNPNQLGSLDVVAKNFNVNASRDIFHTPWRRGPDHQSDYAIRVNCTCDSTINGFLTRVSFTPGVNDNNTADISRNYYDSLVYSAPRLVRPQAGTPLELDLLCGCPIPAYHYILSYPVQSRDILFTIAKSFESNYTIIGTISGVSDPSSIAAGEIMFVPIDVAPSTVAQVPSSVHSRSSKTGLIIGIVAGLVFLLIVLLVVAKLSWRKLEKQNNGHGAPSLVSGSQFSRVRLGEASSASRWGLGTFSLGNIFSFAKQSRGSVNNNVKRSITFQREAMNVFDQEKPFVFNYDEIITATNNFNPDQKLGQGAFGVVYCGNLRQQDVAIKHMKATKSREFWAELKVLCKVHHTNLVELIGYSAGDEDLFLVYEFAENGALSDHLHNRAASGHGHPPLSWIARVQIALDAARGLEYIHEHTQTHYVHRDVKTSNILLDGFFRAKVADFGLAKLVERTADNMDTMTTRVVGTFGYMAPEYVMDGHATAKTDVYAFGVVLFELITGQAAMARTDSSASNPYPTGRRSLISRMLSVLEDGEKAFKGFVDPDLGESYPFEVAHKMAKLGTACVDEKPASRPDMKYIVLALSQILLSSIEWEASLAGSSQIFSGLVQGR